MAMADYQEPPREYDVRTIAEECNAGTIEHAVSTVQPLVDRIQQLERVARYFAAYAEMSRRLRDTLMTQQGMTFDEVGPIVMVGMQSAQGFTTTLDERPFFEALDAYGRERTAEELDARVAAAEAKRQKADGKLITEAMAALDAAMPAGNG
jgi:hypothetical protein